MQLFQASEYQTRTWAVFTAVAEEVARLLPGARIEHVGASSIPGAVSKGDLDICVVVPAQQHAAAVSTLEAAGHVIKADTLRTPELCMLELPREDADVALQVIAQGSRFEFFMRFRDALRADPSLVEQYNQIKRDHAAMGAERYRDEKARFIAGVLGSTP